MTTINTIENNKTVETINAESKPVTYEDKLKALCADLMAGKINAAEFGLKDAELRKTSAADVVAQYTPIVTEINAEMVELTFKVEYLKAALADVAAAVNQFDITEIAGVKLINKTVLAGSGEKPVKRSAAAETADYTAEYTLKTADGDVVFWPPSYKTFQDLMTAVAPTLAAEKKGASMFKVFGKMVAGDYDGYTVTFKDLTETEIAAKKAAAADKKGVDVSVKGSLSGYKDIQDSTNMSLNV